ncbi:hypothetical protein [Flavivirga jejuensis]|uniref:AAA+ ATPase domain-containing protein n=1 Tax=Flavivirga jejuensis TaxID=870487 RepID=A0ABT8WW80_9FLAO|nr:hypothetical protein [Flavivirga jejuensis]MDO5977127.1 hypothetical protein [Flavivirga jejuensis]
MEDKTQTDFFEDSLKKFSDFIKISFKDLIRLTHNEKKVFLDLYYNRVTELNKMQSILKNIRNRGDNILILGHAGTGKSSFMYKVFFEIGNLPDYNLYPLIVDFRDGNKFHLYKHFIEKMEKYFSDINCPIPKLITNNETNFKENISLLRTHLANIDEKCFTKHLIILLDDFDYLDEDDLFDVLEDFQGFGIHRHATLVLSARPALYTAIKEYDNRLIKTFTREIHKIKLVRLDINKLISRRLAGIIIENKSKSWFKKITHKESDYIRLLKKMGISEINDIENITIPFTGLYLNFISNITNHNNREIFDIVHDSLIYVRKNFEILESISEKNEDGETHSRKNITKEQTLELFYDNDDSLFRIININKNINKKGNSLLFNLLEGVKLYKELNRTFTEQMNFLGHKEKEIIWGIKKLKLNNLISPTKIVPNRYEERIDLYPEFSITDKGDYYLTNICYWEEYINRCGHFGVSIHNNLIV